MNRVLSLSADSGLAEIAAEVAAVLRAGSLVVLPTETVYGVMVDAFLADAAERIYAAKGRDKGKPLQLLISDAAVIERMGFELNEVEKCLADKFWPGGMTLVVERGGCSEGFRIPACDITLEVIRQAGGAVRASSANLSGEPPALSVDAALGALGDSVSLAVDGGPVVDGVASSVVRVLSDGKIEMLREGAIRLDAIMAEVEKL